MSNQIQWKQNSSPQDSRPNSFFSENLSFDLIEKTNELVQGSATRHRPPAFNGFKELGVEQSITKSTASFSWAMSWKTANSLGRRWIANQPQEISRKSWESWNMKRFILINLYMKRGAVEESPASFTSQHHLVEGVSFDVYRVHPWTNGWTHVFLRMIQSPKITRNKGVTLGNPWGSSCRHPIRWSKVIGDFFMIW